MHCSFSFGRETSGEGFPKNEPPLGVHPTACTGSQLYSESPVSLNLTADCLTKLVIYAEVCEISGHVELLDGVAHFSNLSYKLPGAIANVQGTYSFDDERIDLHGQLRVDTKFSKTGGGPKGLLTRVTEGLFAKGNGKGEILPVKLTGTYEHPSWGLDK